MKILILIPTFDRPNLLKKLLGDIEKEIPQAEVMVFEDATRLNYKRAYEKTKLEPIVYSLAPHAGKQKWWEMINIMFGQAKDYVFDYCLFLPDDVRLKEGFLDTTIKAFKALKKKDKKFVCLSPGHANGRAYKGCWTGFTPVKKAADGISVLKTQWMDMCFFVERKFFDKLDWEISAIHASRWNDNPQRSTGVGKQISVRLHAKKLSMYHIEDTQVIFSNDNPSMMQKHLRARLMT